MEFSVLWLIAAFGGGAFGAAIGGQTAFIFTGLFYLVGLGGFMGGLDASWFMSSVVFGPVFGPHIAFAGGAAAAAYAGKKKIMADGANGRDIVSALAGLNRSDVLIVGGLTGMVGYTLNQFFAWIFPTFGSDPALNYGREAYGSTDTVAFTIIVIAIAARYIWGTTGLLGNKNHGLFEVGEGKHWVAHQEKWSVTAAHGLTAGLISAFATLMIVAFVGVDNPAVLGWAQLVGWAISAVTLIFLSLGMSTPVTHQITILASIAALLFAPILAGNSDIATWGDGVYVGALIIGGIFGVLGGLLCEALSRATNAEGDTHIDPPAFAIWTGTTLIYLIAWIVG